MRNTWIYPYRFNSRSASNLARGLGIKRIKSEGSTFRGKQGRMIINWGSSYIPDHIADGCVILNETVRVELASNKLNYFNLARQVVDSPRIPDFTTSKSEALRWFASGHSVIGRSSLTGHSGQGIYFFDELLDLDNIPSARMYVKYIKKSEEYRIHYVLGRQIDIQRKVLRVRDDLGREVDKNAVNWRVRSHCNGFVFQRSNIEPNPDVLEQARKAYLASGLDFGAIDVIWNTKRGEAYVLEVNTAPGLEGQTVEHYVNAFNSLQ